MSGNYSNYGNQQSNQQSATFDYSHGQRQGNQWDGGQNQPYTGNAQQGYSQDPRVQDPRVRPTFVAADFSGHGGGIQQHQQSQGYQQRPRFSAVGPGPLQRTPRPQQASQQNWQTQSGWQKGGILDKFRQPNPATSFNQATDFSGDYSGPGTDNNYYQGYTQPESQMDTTFQSGPPLAKTQSWPPKINLQGKPKKFNNPAKSTKPPKELTASNPLQMLHLLGMKVTWHITGEAGSFTATVQYGDKSYDGKGSSKKAAQHSAARLLLQALGKSCPEDMETNSNVSGNSISELNVLITKEKLDLKLNFVFGVDGPPFRCYLTIGSQQFEGGGPTKKTAKAVCAANTLNAIKTSQLDITPYKLEPPEEAKSKEQPDQPPDSMGTADTSGAENPLAIMHRMFPGLAFSFPMPVAPPGSIHEGSIEIKGKSYKAGATTKRAAKIEMAKMVLADVESGILVPPPKAPKTHTPKKRKASELAEATEGSVEDTGEVEPKKVKLPDNPISQVIFYFPGGVEWSFTRQGPPHEPVFFATATLIGYETPFEAQGESKKKAKYNACTDILAAIASEKLKPPPPGTKATIPTDSKDDPVVLCSKWFGTLDWQPVSSDETGDSDDAVSLQITLSDRTFVGKGADQEEAIRTGCTQIRDAMLAGELPQPISEADNAPWGVVGKAFGNIKWDYKSTGPVHEPAFYAFTTIQGVFFEAVSGSKKAARHECCRKVLDALNAGIVQVLPRKKAKGISGWYRFNRLFKSPEINISHIPSRTEGQDSHFVATATIFGTEYSAPGASELVAKEALAMMCNDMHSNNEIQIPVTWEFMDKFGGEINVVETNNKFSASYAVLDKTITVSGCESKEEAETSVATQALEALSKMGIGEESFVEEKPNLSTQTPLAILNSATTQKYEFVVEQPGSKSTPFIIAAEANGKMYRGSGRNKMAAKQACASVILSEVYGYKFDVGQSGDGNDVVGLERGDIGSLNPQSLSTTVQTLIEAQYSSIAQQIGPRFAQRKVLAGCVLTIDDSVESAKLLAIACGNKCVEGGMISHFGDVVNDLHAEVLVRRVLKRYLCEQIQSLNKDQPSIVERTNSEVEPKYKIKSGVRFHLYISSPPCGDSRLFTVSSNAGDSNTGNKDDNPNRASRGQLRVKIEAGQGTVLFNEPERSAEQNWEAVMSGDRYINMSCSDKVARWSILGFQGSLLSKLLEPVYFSSVIVGSMFHKEHIYRALYGRLKDILPVSDFAEGYKHLCPEIIGTIVAELRNAQKPPSHAVVWQASDNTSEVLDTRKGKTMEHFNPSFVCKKELFNLYRSVNPSPEVNSSYDAEKKSAKTYQEMKAKLYNAINDRGLGRWVSKVPEQDMFVSNVQAPEASEEEPHP